MLLDHRTYTCCAGTIALHLKLYETYGYATQAKHLREPVVYAATETGDVNAYVHIWAYEDAADREARRAALKADPDWVAYLTRSREAGYLIRQENTLLSPVSFHTPAMPRG